MRKREQKLWDRMRNGLKKNLYIERMENVVSSGRPDVDTMWHGITIPVELKAAEQYPARPGTPVLGKSKGLSQNQLNWWLKWKLWGGSGFIVIAVATDVFAVPAKYSDEVNSFTRAQLWEYETKWVQLTEIIKKEATCLQNR